MNEHVEHAIAKYGSDHLNWLVAWHIAFGIVVCDERGFGLAYPCRRESVPIACEHGDSDTLFVTWWAGDLLHGAGLYLGRYKFVAFQRSFNGSERVRIYNLAELHNRILTRQNNGIIST